jgi:hypothetical protein
LKETVQEKAQFSRKKQIDHIWAGVQPFLAKYQSPPTNID